MRLSKLIFVFSFFGLLLVAKISRSQENNQFPKFEKISKEALLSYEMAKKRMTSKDPESNLVKDLIVDGMKEDDILISENKNLFEEIVEKPIFYHFKGDKGSDFEKVENPNMILNEDIIKNFYEMQVDFYRDYMDKKEYLQTGDPIPNCTENIASFQENKIKQDKKEENTNYAVIDQLFVRRDYLINNKLSSNLEEYFGPNVRIFEYSDNQDDPIKMYANSMQIPCLPFRVRNSPVGNFSMSGKESLRLFRDPFSKGKDFHPVVAGIFK